MPLATRNRALDSLEDGLIIDSGASDPRGAIATEQLKALRALRHAEAHGQREHVHTIEVNGETVCCWCRKPADNPGEVGGA